MELALSPVKEDNGLRASNPFLRVCIRKLMFPYHHVTTRYEDGGSLVSHDNNSGMLPSISVQQPLFHVLVLYIVKNLVIVVTMVYPGHCAGQKNIK